jgi:hypothetical protein
MLFMLVNRTRRDLTPEQFQELGRRAQEFYSNIPRGVTLHGDWAAADGSCTYALLEAADAGQLEALQAPFRDFVDIETVPVRALDGWNPA